MFIPHEAWIRGLVVYMVLYQLHPVSIIAFITVYVYVLNLVAQDTLLHMRADTYG